MTPESDGDVTAYSSQPLPRVETAPDPEVEAEAVHVADVSQLSARARMGFTEADHRAYRDDLRRAVEAGRALGQKQALEKLGKDSPSGDEMDDLFRSIDRNWDRRLADAKAEGAREAYDECEEMVKALRTPRHQAGGTVVEARNHALEEAARAIYLRAQGGSR